MDRQEDPNADTFDYGLAPGESFEPETLDEIDRSQPHFMTVLGPVEPGALGVTNPLGRFIDGETDPAGILREIEEAGYVGINALLNFAPLSTADEAERARWLAGRCDLHLLVTVSPPASDDAASQLHAAIEAGIAGTGVFPAAIVTSTGPSRLRAAGQVSASTGLPLMVQGDSAISEEEVLAALEPAGIDPDGVCITIECDAPKRLLDAGMNLLVSLDRRENGRKQAAMIAQLVRDGFVERILPGFNPLTALESVSYMEGSRWSWLIEQFPLMLLDAGLDAMTVRTLMIENPNRALTIHPPERSGSLEEFS